MNTFISTSRAERLLEPRLTARRVRPSELDSLDAEIFEGRDGYGDTSAAVRRFGWIRRAVEYQLENSAAYARLAGAQQFSLTELTCPSDLARVPLVSSGSFKRGLFVPKAPGDLKLCTSSGTRGTKSIVPRDSRTLERFSGTILHGLREFIGESERRHVFVLGPSTAEAGDLWFAYSLGLAELLQDTDCFVERDQFRMEALEAALSDASDTEPLLVSPPSLLLSFIEYLEKRGRTLDLGARGGRVLTAGGWKRLGGDVVARAEFVRRIEQQLGVQASAQRDLFNMVELNSVIFECEAQEKHIPPWLEVIVRRPRDLAPAPLGEEGILTYLDPTALSYPGFVLSDDFGVMTDGACSCGRFGRRLAIARRLTSIEERGCALKMDRYTESKRTP